MQEQNFTNTTSPNGLSIIEKINLNVEKWWPFVLSSIFCIISWNSHLNSMQLHKLLGNFVEKSFVISGILLGFFLTIMTMINSVASKRMQFVKDTNNYGRLLEYLHRALKLNVVLLAISFLYVLLDALTLISDYLFYYAMFFVFLAAYTLSVSIRFSILFISLLADKRIAK